VWSFWNDPQWEAYKEDVQNHIPGKLNRPEDDFQYCPERKLDLDYGSEDWMYTAHFFPRDSVPFDIVEPTNNKMMQKEGDTTVFNKHRNIWICGYQSHKTKKRIRLIRFILDSSHMEGYKGS
jgi:hypothetical protein